MFNNNIRLNHGTGCDKAPSSGPFNSVALFNRLQESRECWVSEKINPRPQSCLYQACSGCPFKRRRQPQAAVLSQSDAGSIEFHHSKPSDFVIHVVSDVWGTLLERGLRFVQRHRTCNLVKEETPFVHRRMKLPNINSEAIEPNPSCSGQAHSKRIVTSHGFENTEPGMYSRSTLRSIYNYSSAKR